MTTITKEAYEEIETELRRLVVKHQCLGNTTEDVVRELLIFLKEMVERDGGA